MHLNSREVQIRLGDMVEVVGKYIEGDVSDDFADRFIGPPGSPDRGQVTVRYVPLGNYYLSSKAKSAPGRDL